MKFNYFILTLLFCVLYSCFVFSQNKQIDSLELIIANSKEDTNKINLLISACTETQRSGDYQKSLEYGKSALTLSGKLNFKNGLSKAYHNIGTNYTFLGIYPEALKNHYASLKIKEETGDKRGVADAYNGIGNIYIQLANYPEALKYHNAALKLYKKTGYKSRIHHSYNNLGTIYFYLGNYPEALKNYSISLKLREELGDKYEIAGALNNIGIVHAQLKNYNEALKSYFASIIVNEQVNDKYGMAVTYCNVGEVYTFQKKYSEASDYLGKSISLAREIGNLDLIKEGYYDMAVLDSTQGNFKQALEFYKIYITIRDSLFNQENTKKLVQSQMQYDFDKKEDSLNQKHIITETKLQVQKKQKYFYWAGLLMLGLLSIFVLLNFRNQKKINKLAAETHARHKTEMELQNQQAILSERLRISSELHDEVGATLSGIAMYSHLTKEQMKAGQTTEIEKSLNVMQLSSTQMVDKLSDIVWLINPEQDSLQKLVTRLEEYATDMAAIKNMHIKITVPEKIANISLPVESRRNIYLFCKEAINNAFKYSNATLLELTVKEVNGKLEFSVSDNGKGFDAVMVRRGNGLENMQKRADEIGATLLLQSKENEGASVSLQCKIT